jgi:hypothetical protein
VRGFCLGFMAGKEGGLFGAWGLDWFWRGGGGDVRWCFSGFCLILFFILFFILYSISPILLSFFFSCLFLFG